MNISMKSLDSALAKVKKFQMGGEMPAEGAPEEGAPVEQAPEAAPAEGGEDPLMQLVQMAAQALQSNDPNLAMQVCQGLIQLVQQAQGGAPAEPETQPVFRKGGVLLKRVRK